MTTHDTPEAEPWDKFVDWGDAPHGATHDTPEAVGKRRPLRAYIVTHYARTALSNTVAARTIKEALAKDAAGDYLDEGWAGEAFPYTHGVARRYPALDAIAAASEETT